MLISLISKDDKKTKNIRSFLPGNKLPCAMMWWKKTKTVTSEPSEVCFPLNKMEISL